MAINTHDDEAMLSAYGYTKDELVDMLHDGEDIGSYFDGDVVDLL